MYLSENVCFKPQGLSQFIDQQDFLIFFFLAQPYKYSYKYTLLWDEPFYILANP